jgi:CBS-domain-containing membrane protein
MTGLSALADLPITRVMSQPVYAVRDGISLLSALAAMITTGYRHLAVVDIEGRCLGVLGDRAIAAAWATDPTALERRRVHRLLDPRPALVGTGASVGEVARRMYSDAVDAVAVIDHRGCPVGLVTGADLIALMARALPKTPATPDSEEAGQPPRLSRE